MSAPATPPTLDADLVAACRLRLTLRILRIADGESALASQIRGWLWADYCAAGAPLGVSEDGMTIWWDERMAEATN